MELWQRFTANARRAVLNAHGDATLTGSPEIDTEHLLVGLMSTPSATARDVLHDLQVDLDQLETDARVSIAGDGAAPAGDEIRFTMEGQRTLQAAYSGARELESDQIGTEHILLGLSSRECGAQRILDAHGVDAEGIRRAISRGEGDGPNAGDAQD